MMQTLSWGVHVQMWQQLQDNDQPPKAAGNGIGWHEGAQNVGHTDGQQLLVAVNPVVILTGWKEHPTTTKTKHDPM